MAVIRVLHVVGNLRLGGGQKITALVVAGLPPPAFEASVCCLEEAGPYAALVEAGGRRVEALGYSRNYSLRSIGSSGRLLRDLVRVIGRERPDIVHTHLFGAGVAGRLAARICGVPRVATTLHRFFYPVQPSVERLLSPITDAVVVDSEAVAALVARRCGIRRNKIHVIYNGIDTSEFAQSIPLAVARQQLNLPPDVCQGGGPVVGIVAHLHDSKGQAAFLDALSLLIGDGIPAHLVLVGEGGARGDLQAKAAALGLTARVHFMGSRRDLNVVLSALDLLVLPSKWEGFGLVLAEAMYKGVPVISTDVGGASEVVAPFETGFLVPFGDVERLRAAAAAILSSPELARRMGRLGRERVVRHFTAERMVNAYGALYESMVARPGTATVRRSPESMSNR